MSSDCFTHDKGRFDPAQTTGGVEIVDAEARYAELVAQVIWDCSIPHQRRPRLETAAKALGLSAARVAQIEEAMIAAALAQEHSAFDEDYEDADTAVSSPLDGSFEQAAVSPLARSEDPPLMALQRRIDLLEERNRTVEVGNESLKDDNRRWAEHTMYLETQIGQLQNALGQTYEELDEVRGQLISMRSAAESAKEADTSGHRRDELLQAARASGEGIEQEESSELLPDGPISDDQLVPVFTDAGVLPSASQRAQLLSSIPTSSRPLALAHGRRGNPADIHEALRGSPRDADLLHKLYDALQRGDDLDRRWCIAHTLVFMKEATDDERETYERHASDELVRPARAVNDDEWRELLFHPGEDQLTGEILAAIAPAMLFGQMTSIRASIAPELIDPRNLVDPKTSTLQAVRCVAWAAAFLGLKVPPLFACTDFDGTADIVLNPTPCTRLGRRALSGRSSKELAFVAGRHLSWYRREHLLGMPRRSTRRLEDMFLAALMIGNPGLPIAPDVHERIEPIAKMIRPLLDDGAIEKLGHCFTRFVELGGRTNLSRWYVGAERTAACSGLLLANDLHAARTMFELNPPDDVDKAIDELIVFFTAGRCSLLRKRIGIAITASE